MLLKIGSQGEDVKKLQSAIQNVNYHLSPNKGTK